MGEEKCAGVFVTRWIQKLSRSFVGNSAKTTFPYSYVVAVSIILYEYVLVTQGRNMLAIRVITRVAGGPKSGAYDSMGVLSLFAVSSSLCCPLPLFLSSELIARCMADWKRTPPPPQQEQWRSSSQLPPPQRCDRPHDERADKLQYIWIPPSDPNPPPIEHHLGFNPVNQNPPDERPLKGHIAESQRREPDNPYSPQSSWNQD